MGKGNLKSSKKRHEYKFDPNTPYGYIVIRRYAEMMNEMQKNDVLSRLGKIEGQIRGISKMINEDRYCIDILTQTSAVASALKKVENLIMEQHLHTCVVKSFKSGDEADKKEKIDEIMDMLSRFRKNA